MRTKSSWNCRLVNLVVFFFEWLQKAPLTRRKRAFRVRASAGLVGGVDERGPRAACEMAVIDEDVSALPAAPSNADGSFLEDGAFEVRPSLITGAGLGLFACRSAFVCFIKSENDFSRWLAAAKELVGLRSLSLRRHSRGRLALRVLRRTKDLVVRISREKGVAFKSTASERPCVCACVCCFLREVMEMQDRSYVVCAGALNCHIDASHSPVSALQVEVASGKVHNPGSPPLN